MTAVQELMQMINKVEGEALDKKMLLSVLKFVYLKMEKQQIEDAANWNGYFDNPKPGTLTGEQYYNETYKQTP